MTQMSLTKTKLAAVLIAGAVLAAACGGAEGAAGNDPEVVAAVAAQLEQNPDDSFGGDFDCVALAVVNGLGGSEKMATEFGLTAASIAAGAQATDVELPIEQARSLAEEALDCVPPEQIADFVVAGGGSQEQADCVIDNFDYAAGIEWSASQFMSPTDADTIGPPAQQALIANAIEMNATCGLG